MKADVLIMTQNLDRALRTAEDVLKTTSSCHQLILLHDTASRRWVYNANRILAGCTVPAICFLNDDVDVTITPNWLEELLLPLEQDPGVGFVGPSGPCRTYPQNSLFPGARRGFIPVSHLSGFCLLCRTSTLRALSGFDEDFLHYGADVAVQWLASRSGFRSIWARHVYIGHEVGGSGELDEVREHDEQVLRSKYRKG